MEFNCTIKCDKLQKIYKMHIHKYYNFYSLKSEDQVNK